MTLTPRQWKNFWAKVSKTDSCWLWTAAKTTKGYGSLTLFHKPHRAHQVSWKLHFGDIPRGLFVCHKCDVKTCINPDHLFLGTNGDNVRDAASKNRLRVGDRHPQAKLTGQEVQDIRALLKDGHKGIDISRVYGVSDQCIYDIKNNRHWK